MAVISPIAADALTGKFTGLFAGADIHIGAIVEKVKNPMWNDDPFRKPVEIMIPTHQLLALLDVEAALAIQ